MALAELVYRQTTVFPKEERYGLVAQMRRAAVSIVSNIAEGQGRFTDGEFANQLSVAHGSIRELETQILLSHRLAMLDENATESLLDNCAEVGRLLNGLARSLRA